MFTGSTLGPVSAGFGELLKEEEAQPRLFLAFLNQSSLPFLQAQPCCWFVLFFGYLHYLGSRFFYVGATFFLYRGNGGFPGSPTWCLLIFFIYASGYSRHHLLGCHEAAHPQLLVQGSGGGVSQRERMCQFSNPAKVGVCACWRGRRKLGGLFLSFVLGLKRGWA